MHAVKDLKSGEMVDALIAIGCVLLLGWFVLAIFRWFDRFLFSGKPQPIPDREAARQLLETPVPSSDPKLWVRYKLEPEFVPAPQALIHVPSDAEHRATCARCQEEWKRSGRRAMPHATN